MSSVVGLDIGMDVLRAIEVENADKAKPTIVRYGEAALPAGAVVGGEVREINTVAESLKKLWSSAGFKSKNVVIGMGNQRVFARDLTVPRQGLEQIRQTLPFQVQDVLPMPVSDALLDFYPISEGEGDGGLVVNGLLIAAVKEAVLGNVKAVRKAGLTAVQVDVLPFALTRALTRGSLGSGTLALIDVGATTTNVVIVDAGVPQFIRMIPAGGNDLTKAVMSKLEIDPKRADAVKRARGISTVAPTSEQERSLDEVIYATVGELLGSLRSTISYFATSRPDKPVRGVVLSGGASQLIGFAEALSDMLRLQVISAEPFAGVEVAKATGKGAARVDTTADPRSMTMALGLALGSAA